MLLDLYCLKRKKLVFLNKLRYLLERGEVEYVSFYLDNIYTWLYFSTKRASEFFYFIIRNSWQCYLCLFVISKNHISTFKYFDLFAVFLMQKDTFHPRPPLSIKKAPRQIMSVRIAGGPLISYRYNNLFSFWNQWGRRNS